MNKHEKDPVPEFNDAELVEAGVDNPGVDPGDPDVDHLTRADVEEDPGEATRKLPKNDQAL